MYIVKSQTFRPFVGRSIALAITVGLSASAAVVGVVSQAAIAVPRSPVVVPQPASLTAARLAFGLGALSSKFAARATGTADPRGIRARPVETALLTVADLPAGYRRVGEPVVVPGNLIAGGGTTPTAPNGSCTQVLDLDTIFDPATPPPALPPGRTAIVTFSKGEAFPMISEILAAGAKRDARAFVAAFVEQMRRCPRFTISIADVPGQMVIIQKPLPLSSFGDVSAASVGTMTIGDMAPIHLKIAAFAKGRFTGTVMLGGATTGETGGFATIVRKAVRKLRALQ